MKTKTQSILSEMTAGKENGVEHSRLYDWPKQEQAEKSVKASLDCLQVTFK